MEDLSVKDAAAVLRVPEDTVLRWIRQGVIPIHKVQGEFRFSREKLEAWARRNRIGSQFQAPTAPEPVAVSLLDAVARGGVHHDIPGTTPEALFRAIVKFFPYPAAATEVPREALLSSLLERESLASTAIGKGIALPHPRHPQDWGLGAPVVGIFYPRQPVDFGALDGQGVRVLFMILCETVKSHLKMLSLVSHFVNNPQERAFLEGKPDHGALLEHIKHAFPVS